MRLYLLILTFAVFSACTKTPTYTDADLIAASQLIERVTPGFASQIKLEKIDAANGKDVFEIENIDQQIILRGNNPVALASAYNWYLKYTCQVHRSWCGQQMNLPKKLPLPAEKTRKIIDAKFRVLFNYCTLNYTASWWNWERWQQEIDFAAMNGINMPLSVIGLEGVWYNTLLKFGFSDEEARSFLVGPAYFAWQWMTNIQSHGGPLPKNWIDTHITLGQKIINRQLELGMKPIQQGFTGYVPREFMQKFPDAKILQEGNWCDIEGTAQLDPLDPLFKKFGRAFMEEQQKLFGTHGVYAADPFHEGHPPNESKEYMNAVGNAIYELMTEFDPDALWAMQAWSIRKDIATVVPKGKLLVLDLNGSKWKGKDKFWGYDFVVGNLHSFGGRINLHGDMQLLASNQYQQAKKEAPNATGSGLFMESIMQNPAYYDLAFEMAFHKNSIDLNSWIKNYAQRRYGAKSGNANKAWELLLDGPYRPGTNGVEKSSIICARPSLTHKKSGPNAGLQIPYNPTHLIKALELLLKDAEQFENSDAYRFDVVDLQRQILSNLGQEIDKQATAAFFKKDKTAFNLHANRFLQMLKDADKVTTARPEYRLSKWIEDARSWGKTEEEKNIYEYNASLLVTQWGGSIFDYAWREWGGLINGYYLPRWEKYFAMLNEKLEKDEEYTDEHLPRTHNRIALRANDFYANLDDWEKNWIKSQKQFALVHENQEITIVKQVFDKYQLLFKEYYK